ncbi:MAG: type IV secretory system conjugative DNA transfer family protein, partial [bacterium]|nr:type IV secretory system conjugative DNA transfer family protein [bacterium]
NPTLPDFAAMLRIIQSDFGQFKTLAKRFESFGVPDITTTCAEIIDRKNAAPEEYSGVMSTLSANMQFMADPRLKELFSRADFSLDVLTRKHQPAVVDIAFPAENLGIWSKALRLIIGTAILYQQRSAGGAKPLFQIDEAAQLGHFEELERSYTYGRSFYRTLAVFQDIGQIEKHYGKAGVQTFLGSSQARIFIGVRDYETAQLVSNMLGNQTIEVENPIYAAKARHARQQAVNSLIFNNADPFRSGMDMAHWARQERHRDKVQRPLLTPDEVLTMPENRALVFVSGKDVRPIPALRVPYFKNPALPRGAFLPNPYHV